MGEGEKGVGVRSQKYHRNSKDWKGGCWDRVSYNLEIQSLYSSQKWHFKIVGKQVEAYWLPELLPGIYLTLLCGFISGHIALATWCKLIYIQLFWLLTNEKAGDGLSDVGEKTRFALQKRTLLLHILSMSQGTQPDLFLVSHSREEL